MAVNKIFISTLLVIMVSLLAVGFFTGTGVNFASADDVKEKISDKEYLDYIRNTATTEVVGDFTKYFIPDTKTVEIYDDKLKPMLNMTWLTKYEEKVSSGTETEVACARIDYIDDKVLPVFNQIKSYDKKNNYESIDKDFIVKIKRPKVSERCYDEVINNKTNESQEICYEYDDVELIEIDSLIDVKYFPQKVCWYTETVEGENIEFVIGNGDFWLVEFASFLVDSLVSYYKMDDDAANTAVDDELDNNEGTFNGGNTEDKSVTGKINKALTFDGTDWVVIGTPSLGASAEFTFGAWIKTTQELRRVMGHRTDSPFNWRMLDTEGSGFARGFLRTNSELNTVTGTTDVTDGNWHLIVYSYDGTTMRMYVDNILEDTEGVTDSPGNLLTYIAKFAGQGDLNEWEGDLDGVGIWARALTDGDISVSQSATGEVGDLWNSGIGIDYPFVVIVDCQFSGFVKDEQDNALEGANVTVWNQFDVSEFYEDTTDVNGLWTINISNSTNTYMAGAYFNNTIIGQLKPYISGTC